MKKIITERIAALRKLLNENEVSAFIIPSTDPHLSEYVASHWKTREWISGFTGSAGTIVVTGKEAGLWTDSRYYLQATDQLEETGIKLYKDGLAETPSISQWLCSDLQAGQTVGIDGKMFSVSEVERMKKEFAGRQIDLRTDLDPAEVLWKERPSMPQDKAYLYPAKYAGTSCTEKIGMIRQAMKSAGAGSLLVTSLDEIAWTLNIRGNDVAFNPVVISYLLIDQTHTYWFASSGKLTDELKRYLSSQNITLKEYNEINRFLSSYKADKLLIVPDKTNYSVYSSVHPDCGILPGSSPVSLLKSIRNETELEGIHAAMIRDGVALTKFLYWLDSTVSTEKETELSVARKLYEFRVAQKHFMGESFETIAGYGANGAIVHYSATPESNSTLKPKGFLLLDSGAQYLDGTTDITRTIALGELSETEKRDYTLILKGHIDLAMAIFPYGTRGTQLDILARLPIWKHHMNFLHGTGHGVGHFLCVHEGPQSIRMNENPVILQPGMVTSNEPGVYLAGSHGIRIENLILVCPDGEGMYGTYLKFETISLCPICRKGILKEMLTPEETDWLNEYHRTVFDKLSPYLEKEELHWLKEQTSKI